VKATHTTYSSGLKEQDEAKARRQYGQLKQFKGESLTAFKDRMEIYVRSMESLGLAIPTQGQLAADNLDKLNEIYDNKRSVLLNNARLGGSYPKTLFEAYKIMTELVEPNIVSVASASVFKIDKEKGGKDSKNEKEDGEEKALKGKCWNCGEPGHPFYKCPNKKKDGTKSGSPTTPAPAPTPTPNSGNKNKTAKGNFTQQEVMEFFGFSTMCFKVEEGESHMLNQVLLHNQAQASIFGNPNFLEDLKD